MRTETGSPDRRFEKRRKRAVDHKLEKVFRAEAEKRGAQIYTLDIAKVRPLQSVRLKCIIPQCEYYGVCKVCPPRIPGVAEFREALESYEKAFLVVLREKIIDLETYRTDFTAELRLLDIVSHLEMLAFKEGHYLAVGLGVGGCKLCEVCSPPGEPCRHPFRARPSPEGFGIDITALAREAGVPLEWPPKRYVNFIGLVLV